MPDILWIPPPVGLPIAGTAGGYSLASVTGSGGIFDATAFTTLSSYRTQGYLFAVGAPHFPSYDGNLNPAFYGHSAGFWISDPAPDAYHIDAVPQNVLWNFRDFQLWKNEETAYPIPTPNDFNFTFLEGQFGIVRGDNNSSGADINFQGVTVPAGSSLLYVQGTGGNPFDGSSPGSNLVGFSNPSNTHNYLQGTTTPAPNQTKIQMALGQNYGSVTTAYNSHYGQNYPHYVYDHLDLWYPDTLYYLYTVLQDPDTGIGPSNSAYVQRKHVMIDAPEWFTRPGGNKVAWGKSDMSNIVSSTAQVAQIGVYRPAIKDTTDRGNPGVYLDTSVTEAEATNTAGGKYAVPAGCNPIWLPNGALVAIYRTRTSTSGAWSHWWRINWKSGEQSTQPTISTGAMGNWSARQALTIPTSVWCQIARGQGKIVALYNDGSITFTPSSNTYTRTAGTLYAIVALDSLCQTWSSPITIATGVMPLSGGLCYTGECWVACYTRNSDLVSLCKRCFNLNDWSGATGVATGLATNGQNLHCFGLCYARDSIQGVWSPYADAPDPSVKSYYLSVYSSDQGRNWQVAQPSARLGSTLVLDGCATRCSEMALLQQPGYAPAMQYSDTKFRLTTGSHSIP